MLGIGALAATATGLLGSWDYAPVVGWIAAARDAGATVAVSTHDADLPHDVEHRLEAGVSS
jgi:hypothetical protein